MAEQTDDANRFLELLPFYVNQTLSESDQAWMERQLSLLPHARNALEFERLLSQTVQATQSQVPEAVRLARMLSAWKDGRPSQRARSKALWFGLGGISRGLAWGTKLAIPIPAVIGLCVVLLGQGLYIARNNMPQTGINTYRGAMRSCSEYSLLRVRIKPDARMEDFILLMRKASATLKAGPSENGEVWVSIAPEQATTEGVALLKASAIVEDVMASPPTSVIEGCQKK